MTADSTVKSYLPKAGIYFGIIGLVSLLFFTLIFQEDWMHRFTWLWFIFPLPVIFLIVARRFSLTGGLLMVVLGIAVFVFDIFAYPGNPGQIAGRGIGYTLIFVSLPLIASGVSYILYRWKSVKLSKKVGK
jgi:hypothetical protein